MRNRQRKFEQRQQQQAVLPRNSGTEEPIRGEALRPEQVAELREEALPGNDPPARGVPQTAHSMTSSNFYIMLHMVAGQPREDTAVVIGRPVPLGSG